MNDKVKLAGEQDQYRELNLYGRHYDQRLWMVPGAAYTLSLLFYSTIFKTETELAGRTVLSVLNVMIFSGFLMQFVKDRCFQLRIQNELNKFDDFDATMGRQRIKGNDRWFIKFAKRHVSAANYVFYVMFISLILHILVAAYYLYKMVSSCGLGVFVLWKLLKVLNSLLCRLS